MSVLYPLCYYLLYHLVLIIYYININFLGNNQFAFIHLLSSQLSIRAPLALPSQKGSSLFKLCIITTAVNKVDGFSFILTFLYFFYFNIS